MDDINSIVMFEGAKPEAEPAKAEPTGEVAKTETAPPAESTRERDETGKFKAKEPEVKVEPEKVEAKPEVKAEKGQMSALLAERGKRQEAERALQEMRERIAALEAGKTEKADIFTDPEKAVGELVAKQVAPLRERFFNQSIKAAEKSHAEDWEQVATAFADMAEKDATLWERLRSAEDPGEFIYETGSNTPEFRQQQARKAQEMVSAKDAEIATLKAQLEELKKSQAKLAEVPESLNRQPSGAIPSRNDDEYSINNIVRFK